MWTVITTDLFNEWLEQQDEATQEKVLAALVVLQQQGPSLGRPLVDTVYDSKFTNMKGEFKHEVRQFEKSYDNQQAEQISLMV